MKTLYLQTGEEGEVTWCVDRIEDADPEYRQVPEAITQLQQEYYDQDSAFPKTLFIVEVQEKRCVGVMEDGATSLNSYDSITAIKWSYEGDEGEGFDDLEECVRSYLATSSDIAKFSEAEIEKEVRALVKQISWISSFDDTCKIKSYNMGYIWYPVEFCFTLKAAQKYMKANAHNHGKLRTWIRPVAWRNWELIDAMEFLGLKNKVEDIHSKKRGGMNQVETKYLFQIVEDYLRANHYDGFHSNEHGCTCRLDDGLFGCNFDVTYCVPAVLNAESTEESQSCINVKHTVK
jgi:hypothetical protein